MGKMKAFRGLVPVMVVGMASALATPALIGLPAHAEDGPIQLAAQAAKEDQRGTTLTFEVTVVGCCPGGGSLPLNVTITQGNAHRVVSGTGFVEAADTGGGTSSATYLVEVLVDGGGSFHNGKAHAHAAFGDHFEFGAVDRDIRIIKG